MTVEASTESAAWIMFRPLLQESGQGIDSVANWAAIDMHQRKILCRWLQFEKVSATIWPISIPTTWIGSSIWPANTDTN
jgi:hypothetical protein